MSGRRTVAVGRLALCLALGVLSLVALPSGAAQGTQRIVMSGSTSGYVDIVLTHPTQLDDTKAQLTGRGRYTGFALDRLGDDKNPVTFLYVWFRDAHVGTPTTTGGALGDGIAQPLPAGTYRAYLLTDGPGSISFPVIRGTFPRTMLKPQRPTRPRYRLATIAQTLSPNRDGLYDGHVSLPVTVTAHDVPWITVFGTWPDKAMVHHIHACITAQPPEPCDPPVTLRIPNEQAEMGPAVFLESRLGIPEYDPDGHFARGEAPTSTPANVRLVVLDRFLVG